MRPVLTPEQSRRQDAMAADSEITLLDRAGMAAALEAVRLGAAGYGRRAAVLAGPGNNGGDGYAAARYLAGRGAMVDVYALAEPKTAASAWAREAALRAGASVRAWSGKPEGGYDLVIDALFGGGFRAGGRMPDLSAWAAAAGPAGAAKMLAVDVPSGLDAASGLAVPGVLAADAAVTFGGLRVGHLIGEGPDLCGRVTVADIGLPETAPEFWLCGEEDAPIPVRRRLSHKWSAGSVLVAGGSAGIDGAVVLAARSALRAGAGAVMIACPPSVEERVRAPEIMTRAVGKGRSGYSPSSGQSDVFGPEDAAEVLELAERFDAVVLGMGMGAGPGAGAFVREVLAGRDGPLLVDADGLNALAGRPESLRRPAGGTVITPHAAEFTRLAGRAPSYQEAGRLAHGLGITVLLKGAPTFVMGPPAERWAVASGGPELATIGTGDVLAGMIGAFWAAGLDAPAAARSAAYWHGRAAADLQRTRTVTADRLAEHIAAFTNS